MSITLHHLRASRSARIFWVLEELGLKYDVSVHDFGSPEWAELSPFAKVGVGLGRGA
jgi:glutathione S-transferase